MTKEEMLALYQQEHPEIKEMDAWQFGGDPDTLAELVVSGIKTATCSCKAGYAEDELLPKAGDLSMILNSKNEAVCIIQTTRVYECEYQNISSEHAWKEGEGDRSLAYWQKVHQDFFERESQEYHYVFNEHSILICEEFEVVLRGNEYGS